MKSKWKVIWGSLAIIIIAAIIIFNISRGLKAEVLEIQPTTLAYTFKEEGKIVPLIELPIVPLSSAKILELPVKEGQKVQEGDVLAVLDTTDLHFQLEQLQGQLTSLQGEQTQTFKDLELEIKQLELDLNIYETNLKRTEELYKTGALTKKDLEDAQKLFKQATLALNQKRETLSLFKKSLDQTEGTSQYFVGQVAAIQAQIEQLQYQIDQSILTSPIKGVVANLNGKEGEFARGGVPLMNIIQTETYQVEVFVLAEDVISLQENMDVLLIQSTQDKDITFPGFISNISPTATEKLSALGLEEQRVKVIIDFETSADISVVPGSKLDVEFTTYKRENQLVVPKSALFPYEDGSALWVVRQGKAYIQPVVEGFQTDQEIAITEGLTAGDLVILNPQLEGLKEGKKIIIKK